MRRGTPRLRVTVWFLDFLDLDEISSFLNRKRVASVCAQFLSKGQNGWAPARIAPGSWAINEDEWSQAIRNTQADVLDRICEKEKLAIEELKKTLALMR